MKFSFPLRFLSVAILCASTFSPAAFASDIDVKAAADDALMQELVQLEKLMQIREKDIQELEAEIAKERESQANMEKELESVDKQYERLEAEISSLMQQLNDVETGLVSVDTEN